MRTGLAASAAFLSTAVLIGPCAAVSHGQEKVLKAVFTTAPIQVDGKADVAWEAASAQPIDLCMNPKLTQPLEPCDVSGTVQALWNGPQLYLLVTVTDPDVDLVLRGKPLPEDVQQHLETDPYLDAGTYDKYYGGLKTMMPWAAAAPKKTPAKEHSQP
ncbi:MAG TPA: sugar-binding protein [Terracidiphilus sp.]|jgi:hypothetical protein|nr:sugar-binding protein [Terracidiphilus sp.]